MLKIAICEDNPHHLQQIQSALMGVEQKLKHEFEIDLFKDGKALVEACSKLQEDHYAIMLFDIIMQELGGISAAEQLRQMGWREARFIFVSGHEQYWRELYFLGTAGFIDKPFTQKSFEETFIRVYQKLMEEENNYFEFIKDRATQYIALKNIVYFEVENHTVSIHLQSKGQTEALVSFHDKLSSIWERLKIYHEFVMPTKSYLINLDYVREINSKKMKMMNGEIISISRQNKEETRQRYLEYFKMKSRSS